MNMKFFMGAIVEIARSAEVGSVIGRKQEIDRPNEYYVRYIDNADCSQKRWFDERELKWPEDIVEEGDVAIPPASGGNVIALARSH